MNLNRILSKYSKILYQDKNDWVVTVFWNSLYTAFFLLPLGINLPTPFFIVSIVLGSINIFRSKKKFIADDKALLLFPIYFIFMAISLIYSNNITAGLDLMQRSLSLLFFPLIFIFVKEDASTVKKLFEFLLLGLLVSFFINFGIGVYHVFLITKNDILSIQFSLDGINELLWSIRSGWSYFLRAEFSKLINSNYISLYILLVLSYYLKNRIQNRKQLCIIFILFVYLFLLASIAAYVALFIISLLLIGGIKDKSQKYTMILIFILACIAFSQSPRVFDFYRNVTHIGYESTIKNTSIEKARLLTWDASFQLITEAPLLGYGIGDTNDVLIERYKELNYFENYNNQYNAHNQFLETFLQTGILGFVVLISIFIVLGIRMNRSRNEVAVFIILIIALLFESMLVRFNGIVFFSIVIPLLLKKRSILSGTIIRNE